MSEKRLVRNIRGVLPKKKESVEELASKATLFLQGLKAIVPERFPTWYEQAWSKKTALQKEVTIDAGHLAGIIQKEWDRKFPDLGSHFTFWSGNMVEEEVSKVDFGIGKTTDNKHLNNVVNVSFPFEEKLRLREDDQRVKDIVVLIKKIWRAGEVVID